MPTYPTLGLSVVKNEADIIEAMVRHNLQYLDHMVIFDNGSLDGTVDILRALAAETGRVEVRIDTRAGHIQRSIINGFLRAHALEYDPVQVVLLDGDELINA
ncbi:MAG: glycosyltransferase family 2 protein [Pseudomonadota bacterium]